MLFPIRRSRALLAAALLLPLLPLAVACDDAVTEPDNFVLAEEAESVLQSAAALPTLPDIIQRTEPAGDGPDHASLVLDRAQEIWMAAAAEDNPVMAARRRRSAIAMASPYLAERTDRQDLDAIHQELRGWVNLASGMLRHLSLPEVEQALDDGVQYLARADVAAARGDHSTAVWFTLTAESRLLDTTPRVVARRLADQVAQSLRFVRERGADASERPLPDDETMLRAERLVAGARQALDEEDYLRSIQRAYYARQLLESSTGGRP